MICVFRRRVRTEWLKSPIEIFAIKIFREQLKICPENNFTKIHFRGLKISCNPLGGSFKFRGKINWSKIKNRDILFMF